MISEAGIAECESNAAEIVKTLPDLKIVYVSALRRALQTAHLVLKNHPNKAEIEIRIEPWIREGYKWSAGVPRPLEQMKE